MKKIFSLVTVLSILAFAAITVNAEDYVETEQHEMKADANKDGKVSFEEFKAARLKHMEEHFNRRDINADGFINAEEKIAARKSIKSRFHKKCERKNKS